MVVFLIWETDRREKKEGEGVYNVLVNTLGVTLVHCIYT
jgi:hypothetical protein